MRIGAAPEFRSELFPDSEQYVTRYGDDPRVRRRRASGSATLDSEAPVFSTEQSVLERFSRFFVLGAEHLLFGIDHILFLLALIVGSRRLRDVVLAATSFTIAHSVTFILAALGLVSVPAAIVEPSSRCRSPSSPSGTSGACGSSAGTRSRVQRAPAGADSTRPTARLVVVFGFGLMHGLGFAGALGIDEPFSWPLLGSLLVFNVGIEAVQIAIIASSSRCCCSFAAARPGRRSSRHRRCRGRGRHRAGVVRAAAAGGARHPSRA